MEGYSFLDSAGILSFPAIAGGAVRGFVLLAFAALCAILFRRASAASRHALWTMALAGLLAIPPLSALIPGWRVLPPSLDLGTSPAEPSAPRVGSASKEELPAPAPSAGSTAGEIPRGAPAGGPWGAAAAAPGPQAAGAPSIFPVPRSGGASPEPITPRPSGISLTGWASVAWMAGALAVILRIAASGLVLRGLSRSSERLREGPAFEMLEDLRGRLGIRRGIALLHSGRRSMPLSWGIAAPRILLPSGAESWEPGRLRAVLLHELAHIRRRDALTQLLAELACALHWPDPLAWAAAWRMRVERERACDDLVLRSGVKASDYAGHILEIAAGHRTPRLARAAAVAMARGGRLEGRLRRVLDEGVSRAGLTPRAFAASLGAVLALALPLAAMRAGAETAPDVEKGDRAAMGTGLFRGGSGRMGSFDGPGIPRAGTATLVKPQGKKTYLCTSGFTISDGIAYFQGYEPEPEGSSDRERRDPPEPPQAFAMEVATGKVVWKRRAGLDDNGSTPEVLDGSAWFAELDDRQEKRAWRVDAKTGSAVWETPLGEVKRGWRLDICGPSPAVLAGDTVAFAFPDGVVHALDRETGKERWKASCRANPSRALAASGSRIFYAGISEEAGRPGSFPDSDPKNHIGALDLKTGRELWRREVGPRSHPIAADGKVLVLGGTVWGSPPDLYPIRQTLYALSAEDGSVIWEHAADPGPVHRIGPSTSECASAAVAGSRALFSTFYGHLYAVDLATGKRLWKSVTEGPFVAGPSVAGRVVAVSGYVKSLRAFDLESGEPLWERKTDLPLMTSPVFSGGAVFAVDFWCRLFRVDPAGGPAAGEAPAGGAKVSGPTASAGTISGRVASAATGKPIPKAYVGTGDFGDSGGSNYERHKARGLHAATETDADGRFVLQGLAATGKGKEVDAHPLIVTHPDFVRAEVRVDLPEGEGREVEVRLKPAAKLRVEVPPDSEKQPVLLRLEALDGHRFIPPGRDPHLSAFASSAWTERLRAGGSFTFTGLDEGEYAIDAFRRPGAPPFLPPTGMVYAGGAQVRARAGETVEARPAAKEHGTTLTLSLPEIPADFAGGNPQLAAPFVLIARNPGLLVWADGLARGPEDPRLGRLSKEALFFGALPPGTKRFEIQGLPPGTYAVFTGPVVYLRGQRMDLPVGLSAGAEERWIPPDGAGRVRTHGMDRPLTLAAGEYAVEDLCRVLTEATGSHPAFEASPFLAEEKVTFDRPPKSIWDAIERVCEEKGWSVMEEGGVLRRPMPGETTDRLYLVPGRKLRDRL
jgi:outer membrane protein assembly factor BamB/beta-lactamase regulating signal transducer with metallopeptidase domain